MTAPTLFSSDLLWAPLPLFLLQILLILAVVRVMGKALHAVKQPMVIGEILAGVVLGPSVCGYIPGFSETLFTEDSKEFLTLFSSLGLCFFMLFLGLEVDPVFMMQVSAEGVSQMSQHHSATCEVAPLTPRSLGCACVCVHLIRPGRAGEPRFRSRL